MSGKRKSSQAGLSNSLSTAGANILNNNQSANYPALGLRQSAPFRNPELDQGKSHITSKSQVMSGIDINEITQNAYTSHRMLARPKK